AVEARLKVGSPCARPGVGFWIHDGLHFTQFRISDHEVTLAYGGGKPVEIGPTDRMREYRVELTGTTLTVKVDGKPVITTAAREGEASLVLMFGALGDGCGNDAATWEYIAYEVYDAPVSRVPRDEWHPGTTTAQL